MINFNDDKRILGWNSPTKEEILKLKSITIENQFDYFSRPNWLWVEYPEGDPIYSPQPYTTEQLEQLRNEYVRVEIEKLYSYDLQNKINTENMQSMFDGLGLTADFIKMQEDRSRIKLESHEIDFQIK